MIEKNWAGNYTYQASQIHYPQSVGQVQEIVANSNQIKGLGSRHSFNNVADSARGEMISLRDLPRRIEIDPDNMTVTVDGGMIYGHMCKALDGAGFALHNLASLPHISIVGACMTGTHGSGIKNGNLATSVSAIEFVSADGEIVTRTRKEHPDEFAGMVVSLGALGIVTAITLDIVPRFEVRQDAFLTMPFPVLFENFDAIQSSAYSVSLWTDWGSEQLTQIWLKSLVNGEPPMIEDDLYGTPRSTMQMRPISEIDAGVCTEQLGIAGAWWDRLPHFRLEFTPSHGDEIQSEYFVPIERATEAFTALSELSAQIHPLLYISEIRTVAGDDLWLSPHYGRDSLAFHFTWKPQQEAVEQVLPLIEEKLQPFGGRPHWGKVFTMSPDVIQAQYEKLPDFRKLLAKYDPQGKFRNPYIETYIF